MESYDSVLRTAASNFETVTNGQRNVPWADFFNSPAFFEYHKKDGARGWYFELVEKESQRTVSIAHFTEKEPGFFASPRRGTYGGINAIHSDVTLFDLFIEDIETAIRKAGGKRLQIAPAPFAHHPEQSALQTNVFLRRKYDILKCEVNYDLTVDEVPLIEKMERNNQKRVRKCQREGCVFEHYNRREEYEQVYDVIRRNRESRGFPVTMTLDHMLEMKSLFPDTWQFFGTRKDGRMIAASVCIRLNPETLYVFYWGDLPDVHTMSPVAFHASNLYAYCQSQKIRMLDIGTATDNCIPNVGLMKFKERLGCRASLKLILGKDL
jgi:hypothetical protein